MATLPTGDYSLRGALVSAVLAVVSGRRGISDRAGPSCGPHHDLALGAALRSGDQQALPPRIEADQRFLEGGRNLYLCGWEMAIALSSGRFHRCHDRFLAFEQPGCGRSEALLPESVEVSGSSPSAGNQCRRQSVVPEGDHGTEAGAEIGTSLPMPHVSIPEQYRGTGPSRDQTARECEPRVPILRWCVADDSRL